MPAQTLTRRGQEWVPVHGGGRPFMVGRDGLVAGVDKPTAQTTGVLAGVTLTPVYPPAGSDTIVLSPGTYENREYWGQVRVSGGQGSTATFRNCAFHGPSPDASIYDSLSGMVTNHHPSGNPPADPPYLSFYDSVFSALPWLEGHPNRPSTPSNPERLSQTAGLHGGNFNLQRCEITGVQDGINLTTGGGTKFTIELSRIHGMLFRNNWFGPSDGRSHSDAIQFNRAKNVVIRGNIIGGERDMVGYRTWPGGYNSGDDAWNSGIMLKQESDNSDFYRIEFVLIEKNWIYGGTAGINFPYNPTHPNLFASTVIRDNVFGLRGTGWRGSATGAGTYDTGNGWYIIRSSNLAATITGNIIEGTGSAVPIQNG